MSLNDVDGRHPAQAARPAPRAPDLRLLSLGAGVQSTTLALMAAEGAFPEWIDAAIFADTQWEPAEVYAHLAWLEARLPFPVFRVTAGSILEGVLERKNTSGGAYAAVPWFVLNPDGTKGMGRRQCTHEYKLKPIVRQIRELLGAGQRGYIRPGAVEQWIGISTDEAARMKPARQQYLVNRWPLIERGMSRQACLDWLGTYGYPKPPKSACIGCPFHSAAMWREMRDKAPHDFEHACQIDAQLREGREGQPLEFMHAARVPLAQAVGLPVDPKDERDHFDNACEGMCGV